MKKKRIDVFFREFDHGRFRFELLEWIPSTIPGDDTIFANYKITREPTKKAGS